MIRLRQLLDNFLIWYFKNYGKLISNKKSELLIFGARNGLYYMDNSRALYEWYIKERPQQPVIWLTRSTKVIQYLRDKKYPVASFYSHEGIKALKRAKFGFYTNRALDLAINPDMLPANLPLIFLSHGQSVKNSRLTVKKGISESFKRDIEHTGKQVFKAITSSDWMGQIQAKSQGLHPDLYMSTGFPRNDWMLNIPEESHQEWNKFIVNQIYKATVLYAPTWRMHGEPTRLFPFEDLNIAALASFLKEYDVLLLLRPHIQELNSPANKDLVNRLLNASPNIRLATNIEFSDANSLLPFIDMLVSDYSSIYHDFLLLDRPIALIPYDYEYFESQNGFKYPYMDNLPGPVTLNQRDFLEAIRQLVVGLDPYTSRRERLRKLIYKDLEGSACERVAVAIDNLEK